MPRLITFSRTFPAYHPKAGQPTFFVEKIYAGIGVNGDYLHIPIPEVDNFLYNNDEDFFEAKWHTIRSGNRWKVGDKFSPRVWSGKPYNSKQIQFAPDMEVKKIWNIVIENNNGQFLITKPPDKSGYQSMLSLGEVANNDGLECHDFIDWFSIKKGNFNYFFGQIICWNENINY